MSFRTIEASEAILKRGGSVNPGNYPEETFDLLSIPAFDTGSPEVVVGAEIGSSKVKVEPGDVLLSKIVPHIRRCWVVPNKTTRRQIASGEWIVFRDERFDPSFLKHFLTSDWFHCQFMNTVAGVGGSLVRARPDAVGRISIPVPEIGEQKRIAAILDKADAIRRKRQQVIDLADQLVRSVFLDIFGDPVINPKGLGKDLLGNLIKVSSGNGLTASQMEESGTYAVYGGNGINGRHSEFMFKDPQIVIGRVGVYCGAVHITEPRSWITDNALYIKEYLQPLDQDYLAEALKIAKLNQYAGRAAQPLVSGSRIYPVEILVPPPALLDKFSKAKAKIMSTSSKLSDAESKAKEFFFSLSQQAFAGDL